MSTSSLLDNELPPSIEQTITKAEQASLAQFEDQRRYNLLRFIVPAILILSGIALPFGVLSDISSGSGLSSLENGLIFLGCAIAFWALRRRRMTLASLALFSAVTGLLYVLIVDDTIISGPLTLSSIPEFALLLFPIVLAGVIGGPRLTLAMTIFTPVFTFLDLAMTTHDSSLITAFSTGNELGIYIDPIATQIAMGVLILVTTNSLRRTQRQLNTTRIAYNRERELDRLKNQFISNVNHELRTPLMSMRGYLVLARELGKRNDPVQQDYMLSRGIETVGHMDGIVESILDVRRIEVQTTALDLVPVPVRATIITATQFLDSSTAGERERDLILNVDETLMVMADAETLTQVVLNLLSNACKYSAPGTAIEITARQQNSATASTARSEKQPATVEIAIRDHGLGIPPEQIPLLFHRFVRLDRDIASAVPGTGLGLAICRSYVEAMGGKIWVESDGVAGEGTTFLFQLELAHSVAAVQPAVLG